MSIVRYTSLQLAQLSVAELQRIAAQHGLVGMSSREDLTTSILQWQAERNQQPTVEFSAGMLTGPALEAYAELLDFYDVKKRTAATLNRLSPLALEGVLQQVRNLPVLPKSPHSSRVAHLLMHDGVEVDVKGSITQELKTYFERKDRMYRYLLELSDATLFAVVDHSGAQLVHATPYVQINGTRYDDRLAVAYYLVALRVR